MGTLKEKWSKMTIFFSEMVNLIEVSLDSHMQQFLELADVGMQARSQGLGMDKIIRDVIYSTAKVGTAL